MSVAIGPMPRRLCLRRRRGRGVDDRSCVGRAGFGVRKWRRAGGNRTVSQRRRHGGSGYRPGFAAAGTVADGVLRHQSPPQHAPLPHHRVYPGAANGRCRFPPHPRTLSLCPRRRRSTGAGLLRGLQYPSLRPDAADAGDGPEEGGDRYFRRAGLDPSADRLRSSLRSPRPAAWQHPRLHDARLRDIRLYQKQCVGLDESARRDGGRAGYQTGGDPDAGRYRASLCRWHQSVRHHVRECAGGLAHRLSIPSCQSQRCHRDRYRGFVRTGAGVVYLRCRRPDGALQR